MKETTLFGSIELVELDYIEPEYVGSLGAGAYSVSNEPQKESNPIGFIWKETSRIILP